MSRGGWRWGAGRPGWHLVEERCMRIDVRLWHRDGTLRDGYSGTWSWSRGGDPWGSIAYDVEATTVVLRYSADGVPVTERVPRDRTPCRFGGWRPWFRCPRCAARVAVLYLRASRFACRACQRVAYASQSEDACGRAWRKQAKIEAKLGDGWRRPKGMHRATRARLLEVLFQCEEARDRELDAYMRRHRLVDW
jgi:hypothetical protein